LELDVRFVVELLVRLVVVTSFPVRAVEEELVLFEFVWLFSVPFRAKFFVLVEEEFVEVCVVFVLFAFSFSFLLLVEFWFSVLVEFLFEVAFPLLVSVSVCWLVPVFVVVPVLVFVAEEFLELFAEAFELDDELSELLLLIVPLFDWVPLWDCVPEAVRLFVEVLFVVAFSVRLSLLFAFCVIDPLSSTASQFLLKLDELFCVSTAWNAMGSS